MPPTLSKIKVSLVQEETSEKKTFCMLRNLTKGWCLCCYKHRYHKSQCISKYLLPWNYLSFEREIKNQFNNLIIGTKFPRRQIKDSQYSEAVTESQIIILSFFVKISEKVLWKSSFLAMLLAIGRNTEKPAVLLKKEFYLWHFSKIFLYIQLEKL